MARAADRHPVRGQRQSAPEIEHSLGNGNHVTGLGVFLSCSLKVSSKRSATGVDDSPGGSHPKANHGKANAMRCLA